MSHILELQGYLLMAVITTLTVETSIMSKSIFHTIYQDKSGYTHDTEVILKFWLQILILHEKLVLMTHHIWHADMFWLLPILVIIMKLTYYKSCCWSDMKMPSSDITSPWNLASFNIQIIVFISWLLGYVIIVTVECKLKNGEEWI